MVIMSVMTNTMPLLNKTKKKNIMTEVYVASSWRNSYQ